MEDILKNLRKSFNTHATKSAEWRREQLMALDQMLDENKHELCQAVKLDLNKPIHETMTAEIGIIKNSITYALNNMETYMKPHKVSPLVKVRALYGTYIQYQPFGVVFILGAWNYPLQLLLVPMVGALASGNCCLVKPSEVSANVASLLEKLWPKYFDSSFVALVNGGVSETTELLKLRFDYIFYTGNTAVGKIVAAAAAKYMTPVTLECGGKSPTYIDKSADLYVTAKRMLWGKLLNAGQTCVAPDYVLCTKETQDEFLPILKQTLIDFYGEKPKESSSYSRIINERHFIRVNELIEKSKIVHGGDIDASDKYIEPTILYNVTADDKIMQEEIFGPVLPFITVKDHDEAIEFINEREKPLALYVFTNDSNVFEAFKQKTSSGSIALNETLMQISLECLPFGGVGYSGMGSYHGKFSFDTFSHRRSILISSFTGDFLTYFRYPPYSEGNTQTALLATSEMRSYCNIC